ncbi:hypothetical protein [Komarekiella delphini-convector]|uniref:hypothetical protein n=1 Tax=Komarekiella delphini-convector TaxID=3050158 RepID=UPI001783ACB8|nr:hypothetical protein [Komarekiella delphini-convector]
MSFDEKSLDTIFFTILDENFNELNPRKLNGDATIFGLGFDPDKFAIASDGA